jgi:hypothetical protein
LWWVEEIRDFERIQADVLQAIHESRQRVKDHDGNGF